MYCEVRSEKEDKEQGSLNVRCRADRFCTDQAARLGENFKRTRRRCNPRPTTQGSCQHTSRHSTTLPPINSSHHQRLIVTRRRPPSLLQRNTNTSKRTPERRPLHPGKFPHGCTYSLARAHKHPKNTEYSYQTCSSNRRPNLAPTPKPPTVCPTEVRNRESVAPYQELARLSRTRVACSRSDMRGRCA